MTELVLLVSSSAFNLRFGVLIFMFLTISAVALFVVFLPLVTFFDSRRKEREAFYRAETLRRIAESSGEGAKAAMELFREEERLTARKRIEGLKVGGLVNIGVGLALTIFLRSMIGGGHASPYLCGLIPVFVGVALLAYALFMAPNPDHERRN